MPKIGVCLFIIVLCFELSLCQIGVHELMMADARRRTGDSSRQMSWDPVLRDFAQLRIQNNPDKNGGSQDGKYNIHEIPKTPDGDPLTVEVSVSLRNILEIDEHKQLLTIETTLRLYWVDERLVVKHLLENSSMDYVLLHPNVAKLIWFPDIYIDFAKDLRIPTYMTPPASLRIYRNSTIRYATQVNYDVACPMTFFKYPYDTQECRVKYESYGHTIEKMKVVWKQGLDKSKVTDNNSISLAQFEYDVFFEENYLEEIASGVYPGVIMKIILKRNINYHLLQTYLPSGIFVVVAWLSLFLPPTSIPGRITMAMTTLLTLAAMFGAVRQSTPKVSYVSALDIWMCTCVIFVFFALLEYVIMLALMTNYGILDPSRSKREQEHNSEASNTFLRRSTPLEATTSHGINKIYCSIESPSHIAVKKKDSSNKIPTVKRRRLFGLCYKKHRESESIRRKVCSNNDVSDKTGERPPFYNPFIKFERSCSLLMAILFICFNGFYWSWLLGDNNTEPKFQN